MVLNYLFHNSKAYAGAGILIHAVKPLKDFKNFLAVAWFETNTIIADCKMIVLCSCRQFELCDSSTLHYFATYANNRSAAFG